MDASVQINRVLTAATVRVLRPLIRILLRNGMSFKVFSEIGKRAFVDVGGRDFGIPGRKQTISRVSVLSGLSRKEIQRVMREKVSADSQFHERYNRAARVIAGWVRDPDFLDAQGAPLTLSLEGDGVSFSQLVKRYSGDVPPRAVRDELLRVGSIESLKDGRVRLLTRAYVPRTSDLDKLDILGADVADLIGTIDHNLEHGLADPRFQRKVMYDNLPEEAVAKFRALSGEQAQKLLEEMDRWLAQNDRDANPSVKGTGRKRAGIGIYYFEEDVGATPGGESE
jgi:hypothetical protein